MQKLAYAAIVVLLVVGGIIIYAEWEKKNFTERLPKPPEVVEAPAASSAEKPSPLVERAPTPEHHDATEQADPDSEITGGQSPIEHYDWRTETHPDNHKHARKSDPWRNNDAATQESLPPEAMSDDELGEQTLNQLIERFGDIPEVHAYMEYDRRVRTGQDILLEEDIAYLEAMQFLFPNEATRKTIVLKKWELKNGFILPTAADLEYFKSEGITVLYHQDGSLKKITTKY